MQRRKDADRHCKKGRQMAGKTIRIFLADGQSSGLQTVEVINWTIRVTVVARADLAKLGQRPECRKAGVYFLVGAVVSNPERLKVYVGEAEDVLGRLKTHNSDAENDFWTHTVIIGSKDDNLTKAHVKYLEQQLIKIIQGSSPTALVNVKTTETTSLPESDVADMDGFLEQIRLIVPVLGYKFLEKPLHPEGGNAKDASNQVGYVDGKVETTRPRFHLEQSGVKADAIESSGEFVVLAGSEARKDGTPSWRGNRALRDELIEDRVLIPKPEEPAKYIFARDYSFSSPSQAGNIVLAAQVNGRTAWMHEDGDLSYAEWHQRQLAEAMPTEGQTIS